MLHLLETKMPFMTVVSHIEQPPIHSLAKEMTQFPLEVATPSHAKVPMEPLSNILTPPSTTILHPPPIEVPTPTIIKVLIDPPPFEVPISPSIHVLIVPIDKVSTSLLLSYLQFLPAWMCAKELKSHQRQWCQSLLNQLCKLRRMISYKNYMFLCNEPYLLFLIYIH